MKKSLFIFLLSAFVVLVSCSDSGNQAPSPASATVTPANNLFVTSTGTITITFSKDIETTSLIVTGDLATGASLMWDGADPQKILHVSPSGAWATGLNKTLTVNYQSTDGATGALNYIYNVFSQILYVSTTGDNANTGTVNTAPKLTVNNALVAVTATPAAILVKEGSYYNASAPVISLSKGGISIYGGFSSSDWDERDYSTHMTTFTSGHTATVMILYDSEVIARDSVLDGLEIVSNTGISVSALSLSGGITSQYVKPTISNCTIIGADSSGNSENSSGISIQPLAYPRFENCAITGATLTGTSSSSSCISFSGGDDSDSTEIVNCNIVGGNATVNTICVDVSALSSAADVNITGSKLVSGTAPIIAGGIRGGSSSTITLRNNIIICNASVSTGVTAGIRIEGTGVIQNNTILGGVGHSSSVQNYGMLFPSSTSITCENNIIYFPSSATNGYGIFSNGVLDSIKNNNIFDCPGISGTSNILYYDGTDTITTVAALNSVSVNYSNNISEDLSANMDSDLRYTGSLTSVDFDTSGLDISGSFTTDRDGSTRSVSWSIGAYEY